MRKQTIEDKSVEEAKAECMKALRDLKEEIKKWGSLIEDIIRMLLTR